MLTSSLHIYCFTGFGVYQVFPRNLSYSCPCPSLRLKCTFPVGVTQVVWSFPGISSIPKGYSSHVIDNSMLDSGVSYLDVNSSSDLKEMYRCIAIQPNNPTKEWTKETADEAGINSHTIATCTSRLCKSMSQFVVTEQV